MCIHLSSASVYLYKYMYVICVGVFKPSVRFWLKPSVYQLVQHRELALLQEQSLRQGALMGANG